MLHGGDRQVPWEDLPSIALEVLVDIITTVQVVWVAMVVAQVTFNKSKFIAVSCDLCILL